MKYQNQDLSSGGMMALQQGQAEVKFRTPSKLTNKVPDFMRPNRIVNYAFDNRRKSAVELLEASKAEYVKSTEVLNNRQELKHPENLQVGLRDIASTSPPTRSRSDFEVGLCTGPLDIELNSEKTQVRNRSNSEKRTRKHSGLAEWKQKSADSENIPSKPVEILDKRHKSPDIPKVPPKPKLPPKPKKSPTQGHVANKISKFESVELHQNSPVLQETSVSHFEGAAITSKKVAKSEHLQLRQKSPVMEKISVATESPRINMSESSTLINTNDGDISSPKSDVKRYSSLSAGAAASIGKDKVDGTPKVTWKDDSGDVRVQRASTSSVPSDFLLKPICHSSLSTSVGVLLEKHHVPAPVRKQEKTPANIDEIVTRRKNQLHRSHSDLSSCRHSRTSSDFSDLSSRLSRNSTEIERFFNEMGLDRTVLDPMLRIQDSRKSEMDLLESLSSIGSQEARSLCSGFSKNDLDKTPAESESDLNDRNSNQTSIVEKNARIIKWLFSVKKARTVSAVNQPTVQNKEKKDV